ncbi:hypothetical protein TSUD_54770 [Trifolium subterraneum]|uniref:Uncharacterized protein n=1 Tax=Trifolium subterraneum TaxID=3900 RepID=A0A2Z6MXH0_TRISU|nr:hypothetical protein TSUD_54770 [Trifolium subterraneum]
MPPCSVASRLPRFVCSNKGTSIRRSTAAKYDLNSLSETCVNGVGDGEENCFEVWVQQRNSSKTWEEGLPFGLKGESKISLTDECKPLFLRLEQEDDLSLCLNLEKTWNRRAPRLECCRALPFSFRRNRTRKVKSEDEDNIKNTFLDGRSRLTLGIWVGRRKTPCLLG